MAPGGIEPTTFALLARRSNQLSYGANDVNENDVLNFKRASRTSAVHTIAEHY